MPAFIDEPVEPLNVLTFRIAGWVAGAAQAMPVALFVDERPVAFRRFDRPDLRSALPQFAECFGIVAQVNMAEFAAPNDAGQGGGLAIRLRAGEDEVVRNVTVTPAVSVMLIEQLAVRRETKQWAMARLRCPACRTTASRLGSSDDDLVCTLCRTAFAQDRTHALDLRTASMRTAVALERNENVSSNPYETAAQALIDRVTGRGGWVLDCGAGSRPLRTRHILNVEIEDYFSTDILAVGEALPFEDDSFDAAVSLAVLEHVSDPFACAQELLRVVKPGGEILCSVPFLQPVHGFPEHYYNMTRKGLANLFREGEVIDCFTPLNGHPVLALQWLVSEYMRGLPEKEQAQFGAMTLGEAASLRFPESFAAGYVTALLPETISTIACLNTIVVRKIG